MTIGAIFIHMITFDERFDSIHDSIPKEQIKCNTYILLTPNPILHLTNQCDKMESVKFLSKQCRLKKIVGYCNEAQRCGISHKESGHNDTADYVK